MKKLILAVLFVLGLTINGSALAPHLMQMAGDSSSTSCSSKYEKTTGSSPAAIAIAFLDGKEYRGGKFNDSSGSGEICV